MAYADSINEILYHNHKIFFCSIIIFYKKVLFDIVSAAIFLFLYLPITKYYYAYFSITVLNNFL
ncbi:hypothetical protein Clst_0006 [Thermoclostridium stercorarium subsp. stercorarium DSM 8532]|nr:hypothetical protein Clst_0006 [Thermoclostridium stercorarium subsp. stercorarium DSM 8532]